MPFIYLDASLFVCLFSFICISIWGLQRMIGRSSGQLGRFLLGVNTICFSFLRRAKNELLLFSLEIHFFGIFQQLSI